MPELELSPLTTDFTYNPWQGGPTRVPLYRDVAALPEGGFVSLWSTDAGVYARFHDTEGQAEDGGVVVSGAGSARVDAEVLADGTVAAFWMTDGELRVQRFDTDGTLIGASVLLAEDDPNYPSQDLNSLHASALADGGYAVSWRLGNNFDANLAFFDADGTARGASIEIDNRDALDANESAGQGRVLDMVEMTDGTLAVLFRGDGRDNTVDSFTTFSDLYVQRFNADGSAVDDPFRLTDAPGTELRGQIAQLADGNLATAWQTGNGIFAQVVTADGTAVSAPVLLDDPEDFGSHYTNGIVALENGGFAVTYFEGVVGDDPVYARVLDASGALQGEARLVGSQTDLVDDAPLIAIGEGRYVLGAQADSDGFEVLQLNTQAEGTVVIPASMVLREDTPLDPSALDLSGITDANGLGEIEDYSVTWLFYDENGTFLSSQPAFPGGGQAYAPGDIYVGASVAAEVTFADAAGNLETVSSLPTGAIEAVNDAPDVALFRIFSEERVYTSPGYSVHRTIYTDTVSPEEDAYPELEVSLTGSMGIYDADGIGDAADMSYQWMRDGVAISGATESTYLPVQADVGHRITAQVTYVDGQGFTETVTTQQTGEVTNTPDPLTGRATYFGTTVQYGTVSVDASGLADEDGIASVTYAWRLGNSVFESETGSSLTVTEQHHVGLDLFALIGVTDNFGDTETYRLFIGPIVNDDDPTTGAPTITGLAQQDETLVANTSGIEDIDGIGFFTYQWLRDGAEIADATDSTYTLGQADVGHEITLRVQHVDPYGGWARLTSAATAAVANVNDPVTGTAELFGPLVEDAVLSVDTSELADADGLGAFSYQWLRDDDPIAGATGQTYTLGQPDVGAEMSVLVSYTDGQGSAEQLLVEPVDYNVVQNVNDPVTGVPVIQGIALEDELLRADTSGVADEDGIGLLEYRWFADGVQIGGATLSEYRPREHSIGAQITVQVTVYDAFGNSERIESVATDPIEALPRLLVGTNLNDDLVGNMGNDTLIGEEGDDRLVGFGGDDSLVGGDGTDTLNGGDGNDTIAGGTTALDLRDFIYAGNGNDLVDAGAGNDLVYAGAGNDTVTGGLGVDEIIGQLGDDVLTGQAWSDALFGGDGDDFLNGGFGFDRLNGGAGADRFFHLGAAGHGSDWVQDYSAAEGDLLLYGGVATADDFLIQRANTPGAGDAGIEEIFVTHVPSGQILWALVDGDAQSSIHLQSGGIVYDLLA
ncbi:hypothetical protein [Salipiger abyssi]|uniref:Putative calcium-binding protein n=1 Tax=Salipiger abyssi TaxID=1250539 RepID=A0A1P8UXN4_9RHOB|nr:hypothetical protein [Salipiger abyssi]APZ54164.1 putative calcium-binding protein [Salipiger abyssi]